MNQIVITKDRLEALYESRLWRFIGLTRWSIRQHLQSLRDGDCVYTDEAIQYLHEIAALEKIAPLEVRQAHAGRQKRIENEGRFRARAQAEETAKGWVLKLYDSQVYIFPLFLIAAYNTAGESELIITPFPASIIICGLILALSIAIAAYLGSLYLNNVKPGQGFIVPLVASFILLPAGLWVVVVRVNSRFDSSPPIIETAKVVRKWESHRRRKGIQRDRWYVDLGGAREISLGVSKQEFGQLSEGDFVQIRVQRGFLGLEHIVPPND